MKFGKFTVIIAVLLMAILAIGAVSAESIDDKDVSIAAGGSDLDLQSIDDSVGDLSAAATTDDVVSAENDENTGSAVLTDGDDDSAENDGEDIDPDDGGDDIDPDDGGDDIDPDDDEYDNIYQITDETYSTYFNDDGTPKDTLSEEGDYVLLIKSLTDKNIVILSGSHIKIEGMEYEEDGEIFPGHMSGSITIGDDTGMAGSIIISNLEINAFNAAAINIMDFSTDITIENCSINAYGNPEESENPYLSVYGINANGFISGLYILNNDFEIQGDAPYSYGIQVGSYDAYANPEDIVIANNGISVIVGDSMAEGIYLDNPVSALVENNTVFVKNTGDNCAYGIQVADSAQYVFYEAGYEGTITSAHDLLINNNYFDIESEFMIYGITVQDFGVDGYDEDMMTFDYYMPLCYQFDLNTTISENTVIANSKRGVVGIGGQTYNMTVTNNDVTAIGTSAEDMATGDALGNHTSALLVQYNAGSADEDYYVVVSDNRVTTNVLAEEINSEAFREYVTFEYNIVTPIIVIDDDSYSTYFNEDGTPKDTLPADGGYDMYIDVIHDKNIIITSGIDITITALTDFTEVDEEEPDEVLANVINGTIFINGADNVIVNGLTIVNENRNGIDIADGSVLISIVFNKIDIKTVAVEENPYFSVYGINANGYITDLFISENNISVRGEAPYNYGIQLGSYGAQSNPESIKILGNNILVVAEGENALMAEAIYLDNPAGALIDGNEIYVYAFDNVFAYGIQVADSAQYVYFDGNYTGNITSPRNVNITNNEVYVFGEYMVYAVTFQSFGAYGFDEDMAEMDFFMPNYYQFELNTYINDNEVYAISDRGVIGIGALAYNVTIDSNNVSAHGTSAEDISSADAFGNDTYALGVNFNAAGADDDYYSFVTNNYVRTDVTAEHINSESYLEYVTFENNTLIKMKGEGFVIDESNYAVYFNEDGTLKDESPLMEYIDEFGSALVLLDNMTNKQMIIDVPLNIGAFEEGSILVNSTISIVEGADGSKIDGLIMEFEANNVSTAIIHLTNVDHVVVSNNIIMATDCAAMMMAIEVESGSEGCTDILIEENTIRIDGTSNYLYGIDVFQTYQTQGKNSYIDITNNLVYIDGGARMAEPIYVSTAERVEITNNELIAISRACAYGIATDSLDNAEISENSILAVSLGNSMVYGITSTNSTDVEITDNEINASGKGVVGIGLKDDETVTIDGNWGKLTGDFYEDAETRDSIGKANAAILNKDDSSTDVTIGENNFEENYPIEFLLIDDENYDQYFDENGNIKEGTIPEKAYILLGNMIGKEMIFDIPVSIHKQEGTKLVNSTISLVEGADGSSITGLTMEFEGNSASTSIISVVDVSNIDIYDNKIVATDCTGMMMPIELSASEKDCSDIFILENVIEVSGTSNYLYGIDAYAAYWSGFYFNELDIVANNITINGGAKMAEAIYVSGAKESLIDSNNIVSISPAIPYAIATDDSIDVEISNNNIVVNATSGSMAYALTSTLDNDITIINNNILAEGQGAVGIGLRKSNDVVIDNNTIQTNGGDFPNATTSNRLGQANAAILNKESTSVTIGENTIIENGPKLIDDSTYSQYFDENGKLKEDCTIAIGDTLFLGDLTNKNLIIDIPVDIKGIEDKKQVNTTVSLAPGADGSSIVDLNMEFTGDEYSGNFAVISAFEVSDILIANNTIDIPDSKGGGYAMAIEVEGLEQGCDNVTISGNTIDFKGSTAGMYGIDVFTDYYAPNAEDTNIVITDNVVNIEGATSMAEPIYLNKIDGLLVANNTLTSKGGDGADAYGIGASSTNNAVFADNNITANGTGMTYGISNTYSQGVTIENNNITAEGTGAVGVGLAGDSNVKVDNNEIAIEGGDFTTISTLDSVGTANAAILDKDGTNTNVEIGENAMTENGKETDRVMTGNGTKDLQNIIDAAAAGDTVDLTGQYFNNVGTVVIDKDIAITGGKIIGAEGKDIFEIAPKSQDGPSEVNITGVDFVVNNANTIVKVTGENATDGTSIEVPAISIKDNTIEAANDDVVTESVTVLELESERPILSPTNDISISGNTIAAGVDPFDFKVTSISSGDDTIIVPQNISTEKKATVIEYSDMTTTTVDVDTDGRIGEYFKVVLKDADGNPLAGKAVQIGFNGKIYNRTTNETGGVKLQINLVRTDIYTFAVSFLGDEQYNGSFVVAKITVNTQKGSLTVPNKSYAASAKTKSLTATFKAASGKVVANKKVTFTVNGKSYSAVTDSKGVATVKVSLNTKGTYSFTAKFAGDGTYAAISKSAKLTIK